MSNTRLYAVPVRLVVQDADDGQSVVYTYIAPVEAPGPDEARETAKAGIWLEVGAAKLMHGIRRGKQ